MTTVVECHTGGIRFDFCDGLQPVTVYPGGELNCHQGEKFNSKNLVGKTWKYKIHQGN